MRPLVAIGLLAMAFWPLPSLAMDSQPAIVTVEAIQCPAGRAESPQLFVARAANYPNLHYVKEHARFLAAGTGLYKMTFGPLEGNYFLRVESDHCSGSVQTSFLSGQSRAISLALGERCALCNVVQFSFENALSGKLPIRPSVGFLVSASGSKRVMDIQGDAYYIDRIPPGKYTLRFELHGGLESEVPIDLTSIGSAGTTRFDVDFVTFKKHLGAILQNGRSKQECYWCF